MNILNETLLSNLSPEEKLNDLLNAGYDLEDIFEAALEISDNLIVGK